MTTLFRRELWRMAPYAGSVGLFGFLALVFGPYVSQLVWAHESLNVDAMFAFLTVIGASVLAVGMVAPDKGSGGIAFLARLPMSPARSLGIKAGSAALLYVAEIALLGLGLAIAHAVRGPDFVPNEIPRASVVVPIVAFAFAASLLASILAPRTMPALLTAPFVGCGVGFVGSIAVSEALDLDLGQTLVPYFFGLCAIAFVVASYVAFARGDTHRSSWRPAVLAGTVLAPVIPLFLIGTAEARAWTVGHVVPDYRVGTMSLPVISPDGKVMAVPAVGWLWCGLEERVFLVDTASGESWPIPQRAINDPVFSPDGKSVLVRGLGTGWLVDVASHRCEKIGGFQQSGSQLSALSWRDGRPTTPGGGRYLEATDSADDPALSFTFPGADMKLIGTDATDGRLVFWGPKGVIRADVHKADGSRMPESVPAVNFDWPDGKAPDSVALSPSTRRLLVANRLKGVLEVEDLATKSFVPLEAGKLPPVTDALVRRASFSRDESRVAVEVDKGTVVLDVATGRLVATLPRPKPQTRDGMPLMVALPSDDDPGVWLSLDGWPNAAVWSPGGRYASAHGDAIVDLETGVVRHTRSRVAALFDDGTCLLRGEPTKRITLDAAAIGRRPDPPEPVQEPRSTRRR